MFPLKEQNFIKVDDKEVAVEQNLQKLHVQEKRKQILMSDSDLWTWQDYSEVQLVLFEFDMHE